MSERPILMSAPMIRALLDGSKTQTRRICKLRNVLPVYDADYGLESESEGWIFPGVYESGSCCPELLTVKDLQGAYRSCCRYGKPGDRLWVRETFCPFWDGSDGDESRKVDYRATPCYQESHPAGWHNAPDDPNALKWKPSIHMPRWASRITLEITEVRVERLQDISPSDCWAEGVSLMSGQTFGSQDDLDGMIRDKYRALWESIHGPDSWSSNPWLWVITFKKCATPQVGEDRP